jgi:hypothetical protein
LNGLAENGPRKTRCSGLQIQDARPLKVTKSAIVTRITVRWEACSNGRMTTRSTAAPRTKAIPSVRKNAGQNERPWFAVSDQQM